MLSCLRVRDLAIIDELELELSPGLNVLTGETGAGKSILVDALELVLGARGRPELVRAGAEQAEVEALFEVADDPGLQRRLQKLDIEPCEELVVRRVVRAGGRTRAYINGRLSTAAQLAELGRDLADICSQHEHHGLVHASTHMQLLDAFGAHAKERESMGRHFGALREAREALETLEAKLRQRAEREDLLRYQLGEIDEATPVAGEETELQLQRDRLRHADTLQRLAGDAEHALYARDGSLCEELARVSDQLADAAEMDGTVGELAKLLDSARAQLEEVARELGQYTRSVESDPQMLMSVEDRLDQLSKLQRKYGGTLQAVIEHAEAARIELAQLDDAEAHTDQLRQAHDAALTDARGSARKLSRKRKKAADKLGGAIGSELKALGMGGARIDVEVADLETGEGGLAVDGARMTALGMDRVEMLISTNKGQAPRPLRLVASGGELSRAMLAIKCVLAGLGPSGVYVFDEVDSGVGGGVAEVIGRKIKDVAGRRQVLCITHLPQIAVFADAHFQVRKAEKEGKTLSRIDRLTGKQQREEIARMLGGLKITAKTRAAAAEMWRAAKNAA